MISLRSCDGCNRTKSAYSNANIVHSTTQNKKNIHEQSTLRRECNGMLPQAGSANAFPPKRWFPPGVMRIPITRSGPYSCRGSSQYYTQSLLAMFIQSQLEQSQAWRSFRVTDTAHLHGFEPTPWSISHPHCVALQSCGRICICYTASPTTYRVNEAFRPGQNHQAPAFTNGERS